MSKVCQVTGKRPVKGRSITRRGIAKKKKGIGLNITGVSKRKFLPNLFKKRFWFAEEKRFVSIKLCAKAIRTIDKKGIAQVIRAMRAKGQKI